MGNYSKPQFLRCLMKAVFKGNTLFKSLAIWRNIPEYNIIDCPSGFVLVYNGKVRQEQKKDH